MPCGKHTVVCDYMCKKNHNLRYAGIHMPECCRDNLRTMLIDVCEAFNESKIHYWVDYGSLLGLIRHNDIIPWDHDNDFGIFYNDLPKLINVRKLLEQKDYDYADRYDNTRTKRWRGKIAVAKVFFSNTNRLHSDICAYERDNDNHNYVQLVNAPKSKLYPLIPIKYFENLDTYVLDNHKLKIPSNAKQYLTLHYGDWKSYDFKFHSKGSRAERAKE